MGEREDPGADWTQRCGSIQPRWRPPGQQFAARRPARTGEPPDFDDPYREYVFDDWTAEGFVHLDHNKDTRITRDEWHFDRDGFTRADRNNDGWLNRREFLGADDDDVDDDREDSFRNLDVNSDRRISREEWHWSRKSFDQRDTSRDGRLTRAEFEGAATETDQGPAYKAGYDRGLIEGRAAGREDREGTHGWDPEGQRELEQADSGYEPRFGPRAEYQAGYRAGFRKGYPEGFGRR